MFLLHMYNTECFGVSSLAICFETEEVPGRVFSAAGFFTVTVGLLLFL